MTHPYAEWLGRSEERTERLDVGAVRALAATLDLQAAPQPGEPLPSGWHWLYFNPVVRRSGLGADGHPRRGGFLPPIELPRRMWAGGRIRYLQDLPVDALATRRSVIRSIEHKVGKRGALCFVTVEHTVSCDGRDGLVEEQDLVYREAAAGATPAAAPQPFDGVAEFGHDFVADATLLFRYSALTFNGHRIHYDQAYAQAEEGYPGLVVHGPLLATLLQQLALRHAGGRRLQRFAFRGVNPVFVDRAFRLEGRQEREDELELWARGPAGELLMSASATLG